MYKQERELFKRGRSKQNVKTGLPLCQLYLYSIRLLRFQHRIVLFRTSIRDKKIIVEHKNE